MLLVRPIEGSMTGLVLEQFQEIGILTFDFGLFESKKLFVERKDILRMTEEIQQLFFPFY